MYKNNSQTTIDVMSTIEDFDIYNSQVLYDLDSADVMVEAYAKPINIHRPDLLATDIYGSDTTTVYSGFLAISNRWQTDNVPTDRKVVYYISAVDIDNLIGA